MVQGIQGITVGTGELLPEYSAKIDRRIIPYVKKRPTLWVPISFYFSGKRNEIKPYLEIPVIESFTGRVVSRTEFDALLTASVSATHPIGVVEYSFRITPVPYSGSGQALSTNGLYHNMALKEITGNDISVYGENVGFRRISHLEPSQNLTRGRSWYFIPGEMYAGGMPDAGVVQQEAVQVESPAVQFVNLVPVEIFVPWFSMGKIQTLASPFFPDSDMPGDYLLYIRVRGAGGYSIERSARIRLEYFDPDTDTAPVVSEIDTTDSTPPTTPVVNITSPYTSSTSMLYASWYAHDPESGIQRYEYGVGMYREKGSTFQAAEEILVEEAPGVTPAIEAAGGALGITKPETSAREVEPDVLPWQNAGGRTEANIRGLNLQNNNKYVIYIKATNGAGMSSIGESQPILVDTTPPSKPTITLFEQISIGQYPNSVRFTFEEGVDEESGVVANFFALGSDEGSDDLFGWTRLNSEEGKVVDVPVPEGESIWLTIESYNGAGLKSMASRELMVHYADTTSPSSPQVVTLPSGYTAGTESVSLG